MQFRLQTFLSGAGERHLLTAMLVVLLTLLIAPGTDPLAEGRDLYLAAVDGSVDAIRRASAFFNQRSRDKSADQLVTAYRGGLLLLESRRAFAPWNKGKLAKAGMNLLNRAVTAGPNNLEVRFLRGSASYHLPGFLGQSAQAEADLAQIAPLALAAGKEGRLDPRMAAATLYYHGEIRFRKGDRTGAALAWRDAVRAGPQTAAGIEASKMLRIL